MDELVTEFLYQPQQIVEDSTHITTQRSALIDISSGLPLNMLADRPLIEGSPMPEEFQAKQQVESNLQAAINRNLEQQITDAPNPNEGARIVQEFAANLATRPGFNTKEYLIMNAMFTETDDPAQNSFNQEAQDSFFKDIQAGADKRIERQDFIKDYFAQNAAVADIGWKTMGEFLNEMVVKPGTFSVIDIQTVLMDVMGENVDFGDTADMLVKYQQFLRDAPEEEVRLSLQKLVKSVDRVSANLYQSDYQKYNLLMTLTNNLNLDEDEIVFSSKFIKALPFVDLLGLGTGVAGYALRGPVKNLMQKASNAIVPKPPMGSNAAILADQVPTKLRKTLSQIKDPEDFFKATGARPGELTGRFVKTKPEGSIVEAGPDLNPLTPGVTTGFELIPSAVTPQVVTNTSSRALSALKDAVAILHPSKTVATVSDPIAKQAVATEEYVKYQAVFGKTGDVGWDNAADPLLIARSYKRNNPTAVAQVLKRDSKGEYVPVDLSKTSMERATKMKGDYMVMLGDNFAYNIYDVPGLQQNLATKFGAEVSNMLSEASQFNPELVRVFNAYALEGARQTQHLTQVLKPFTDAPRSSQNKVLQLISQTTPDTARSIKTDAELVGFGFDENDIKAYRGYIEHQNEAYRARNTRVFRQLARDGYYGVKVADGSQLAAKPSTKPVPARILDAASGDVIDVDEAVIKNLDKGAYARHDLAFGWDIGHEVVTQVLTRTTRHITKLPTKVMDYVPEYAARVTRATHFVVSRGAKSVDGRSVANFEETLASSIGSDDALEYAETLRARGLKKGQTIEVVEAKELADEGFIRWGDTEVMRRAGVLKVAQRSNTPIKVLGDVNAYASAEEALGFTRANAEMDLGTRELVDIMIRNWNKTYSDALSSLDNKVTFRVGDKLPKPRELSKEKIWQAASVYHEHINRINGTNFAYLDHLIRRNSYRIGNAIANLGFKRAGGAIARASNADAVLSKFRQAAFTTYIGLNFMRNFILQPQAITLMLGREHASTYAMTGRFARDFFTGIVSKGVRAQNNLIDEFESTGMSASIQSHILLNSYDGSLKGVRSSGNRLLGIGKETAEAFRVIGFDAGEYMNKFGAYLLARNQYIKGLPKPRPLTKTDIEKIAAIGEDFALNMNKVNQLGSQRGAIGFATQFMSHSIKAAQTVLPSLGGLGSVSLTPAEKVRTALWLTALWGTSGWGAKELVEKLQQETGVMIPPEYRMGVEQGINGYMINNTLDLLDGKDGDLAISKSLSPVSQSYNFYKIPFTVFKSFVTMNPDPLVDNMKDLFSTPAGVRAPVDLVMTPLSLVWTLSGGKYMTRQSEVNAAEMFDTNEKLTLMANQLIKSVPVMSNFLRTYIAATYGEIVNSSGDPIKQATIGETIGRAFGISTSQEMILSDLEQELYAMSSQDEEGKARRLKSMAEETAQLVKSSMFAFDRRDLTPEEFYAKMELLGMATGRMSREESFRYQEYLAKEMEKALFRDPKSERVVESVMKLIMSGDLPADGDLPRRWKSKGDFPGKEKVTQYIDALVSE